MTLRTKLLLIFVVLALVPALVTSLVSYRSGVKTVERLLREEAEARAARMARRVEQSLRAREAALAAFANSTPLRDYVVAAAGAGAAAPPAGDAKPLPDYAGASVREFFAGNRDYFESVTCVDVRGQPLFRVPAEGDDPRAAPRIQTEDFVMSGVHVDPRVWEERSGSEPLRSPIEQESSGAHVYTTVPIITPGGESAGALVADIKLEPFFKEAAGDDDHAAAGGATPAPRADPQTRALVALDHAAGRIVYHTGVGQMRQKVESVMPFFEVVARQMRAGERGWAYYTAPDGHLWLAAYRPVERLNVSVAAAADYTDAAAPVRGVGLAGLALVVLAGAAALALLAAVARRAVRRIERVAAGAAAIAGGDLDQRIDVHSSDETRALAENFNRMSDRLRALIARESETKQFESFMRLSAMLTHDLKNSITSLSMLVGNMEKQFHREEFRADAIWSLREATEKLKRLVSRLNEPVLSLSGEYRRDSRPTDLVALIRGVLARTAEPCGSLYQVEARLPAELVATVEPERIENVVENLVINAMEAMGARGGRLTVEAGEEAGGRVFFSVADTGAGMDEEFLRLRLFRPFSTTKQKGIGLGLFTCREIVEAHGGRLEVESEVGSGTRFRVVLPSSLFASRDRQKRSSKGSPVVGHDGRGA